ncbi:MAG: DUF86 domain-containing protein [Blastocatellia bacterium]|nr:DUF86 domain-containing protein [Blastocatellia bacterium]
MEKDNKIFLLDILDCISAIDTFLVEYDFETFAKDRKTVDAVVRNIEVIGEAANNLTLEFRNENPQIAWRKMIDTRNRIVHGYASVDLEIIWNIAQSDLDQLQIEIETILERMK